MRNPFVKRFLAVSSFGNSILENYFIIIDCKHSHRIAALGGHTSCSKDEGKLTRKACGDLYLYFGF